MVVVVGVVSTTTNTVIYGDLYAYSMACSTIVLALTKSTETAATSSIHPAKSWRRGSIPIWDVFLPGCGSCQY